MLDGGAATVEGRRGERLTPDDVRLQDSTRRRWLGDWLFPDPQSSPLVPYEVWPVASVPPVVMY